MATKVNRIQVTVTNRILTQLSEISVEEEKRVVEVVREAIEFFLKNRNK